MLTLCRNHPQIVVLNMACGDAGGMTAQLTCRVQESVNSRSARIRRMQTSDLLAVSFNTDMLDDDDDHEATSGPEYLADFEPGDEPHAVVASTDNINLDDADPDVVPVKEDVMYMVHIERISAENLTNVELCGSNDVFVKLRVGSVWSFRSSVRENSGSIASWQYDHNDPQIAFEIKGSELLSTPLSIEVYDHNRIRPDELIGTGSGILSRSGDTEVKISTANHEYSGKVVINISFKVNSYEHQLLTISGKQTILIPFILFALDEEEASKKKTFVVLTLSDWTYETPVVSRKDGSCTWNLQDAVATLDSTVLRKQMLEVSVYTVGKTDELVGSGTISLRNLLVEKSGASDPIQFAVHIMDASGNRCGRAIVATYLKGLHGNLLDSLHSPDCSADDAIVALSDRDILLELYDATDGNGSWYDTCFWSKDVELSGWLNIDLNADKDRVIGLRLGSNGLTGSIPKNLYKLQLLTELELFANGLTGGIPSEIGELVHLRTLLLNHNSLTGSIPATLAKCINLEELDLSNNLLTGCIPEDLAIQRLMIVNLSSNRLEGVVPLSFARCKLIKTFLCDMIPYEEDEFYKTYDWIRSHADISRNVGNTIQYETAVRHVKENLVAFSAEMESDSDCFIEWLDSEEINTWPGVCVDGTGNLRSLKLSNTSLRGILSTDIEQLRTLVYLDLSSNALEGFIPDELTTLRSMKFLYLNNNAFEGSLPSALHHMTNLKTLHVGNNHLSGNLYFEWKHVVHLEILNLSSNEFEGISVYEIA